MRSQLCVISARLLWNFYQEFIFLNVFIGSKIVGPGSASTSNHSLIYRVAVLFPLYKGRWNAQRMCLLLIAPSLPRARLQIPGTQLHRDRAWPLYMGWNSTTLNRLAHPHLGMLLARCLQCGGSTGRRLARIAQPVATCRTFRPTELMEDSQH